jgi:hypothetical protein
MTLAQLSSGGNGFLGVNMDGCQSLLYRLIGVTNANPLNADLLTFTKSFFGWLVHKGGHQVFPFYRPELLQNLQTMATQFP